MLQKQDLGHLNWFLALRCAPELIRMGIYPNAKEITESAAAWRAAHRALGNESPSWSDVVCLCVGDGHSPRTGALVAHMSRWEVHSIDPKLRGDQYPIDRLTIHQKRVEDAYVEGMVKGRPVIVLAVHSHAHWPSLWARLPAPKLGVAIPCCVPHELDIEPHERFEDRRIASPKRDVVIWDHGMIVEAANRRFGDLG